MTQTRTDAVAEETATPANHIALYQAIFSVLFTAFLVWSVYALLDPDTLPIKQVKIEGEFSRLSGGKLHELVRDKVRGNFFNLDVTEVRNALLKDPWLQDISVQRVWPDTIQVFVREQTAVARWRDTGLLNRSGQYFAPARETFPDNLPLLNGPKGTQAMMLEKYFYLEKLLQPHGLYPDVLNLNERRAWMLELHGGLKVELGRENFEERTERFVKLVVSSLGPRIPEVEKIDLRYPNGYAVLWKEGHGEIQSATGAL
ncbi:MAG: cell division protein FtsQ/DivIB [Gammaproteobacteria bacterium]